MKRTTRSDKGARRTVRGKVHVYSFKLYEGEHDALMETIEDRAEAVTDTGRYVGNSGAIVSLLLEALQSLRNAINGD